MGPTIVLSVRGLCLRNLDRLGITDMMMSQKPNGLSFNFSPMEDGISTREIQEMPPCWQAFHGDFYVMVTTFNEGLHPILSNQI